MIIPSVGTKWITIALVILIGMGSTYLWGYIEGKDSYHKKYQKAVEKLLDTERELARLASQKAAQDAQKITETRSEASTIRRDYDEATPSDLDPRNCVSDDQRVFLKTIADSTNPSL